MTYLESTNKDYILYIYIRECISFFYLFKKAANTQHKAQNYVNYVKIMYNFCILFPWLRLRATGGNAHLFTLLHCIKIVLHLLITFSILL